MPGVRGKWCNVVLTTFRARRNNLSARHRCTCPLLGTTRARKTGRRRWPAHTATAVRSAILYRHPVGQCFDARYPQRTGRLSLIAYRSTATANHVRNARPAMSTVYCYASTGAESLALTERAANSDAAVRRRHRHHRPEHHQHRSTGCRL